MCALTAVCRRERAQAAAEDREVIQQQKARIDGLKSEIAAMEQDLRTVVEHSEAQVGAGQRWVAFNSGCEIAALLDASCAQLRRQERELRAQIAELEHRNGQLSDQLDSLQNHLAAQIDNTKPIMQVARQPLCTRAKWLTCLPLWPDSDRQSHGGW
jgi:prefoldin subunit 5